VDEEMMQKISDLTGAQYFLAQNTEQLLQIYEQIDALEKTEGKIKEYTEYEELFALFVIPAFLLLCLDRLLNLTFFRRVP
jgi:Ca-activated chloride channel family protein